jgi:hypothetical protein
MCFASCAVGTQVAEAATCATPRLKSNYGHIALNVLEDSAKYQKEYFSLWRLAKRMGI